MRGRVLLLHLRHQAVRLFADGGHDGVDLARRFTIHALDQRIDHVGAVGARAIEFLQGRQVAHAQRVVRPQRLRHGRRVEPQRSHHRLQAFQFLACLRAAGDERFAVALEGGRIAAAQQNVFPLLHLDLEFHLRAACRVDGLRQGHGALHGVRAARTGRVERAPAARADEHQRKKEEGAQQTEADGDFQIRKLHVFLPAARTGWQQRRRQKLSNSHQIGKSCGAPHEKPSNAFVRETLST
ncbi:hypothetical protein D3C87_1371580 [compost metagenome]